MFLITNIITFFSQMQANLQPTKYVGLVADLMPNIKLMKYSGLFMHAFTGGSALLKKVYSSIHLVLILMQFIFILVNMALNADEVNELSGNTITALFFTHCVTKFIYLAVNQKNFYRWVENGLLLDKDEYLYMWWWVLWGGYQMENKTMIIVDF